MAKTFKATIDVRCWKEHTCVHCGGVFAYLMNRKVTGQARSEAAATENARAAALRTVKRDVDQQPCPTCGLYQPDMIGSKQAKRHWWIFWLTFGLLGVLLFVHGMAWCSADQTIYLAAIVCAGSFVANLLADWKNPNRDTETNQQIAAGVVASGQMQIGQAGRDELPPPELRAPSWSLFHKLAFVLMLVGIGVLVVPEVVRNTNGWPINGDWHPPVVGPGDESYIYLTDSFGCVKSYWNGNAQATAAVGNDAAFPIPAETHHSSWGNTIHVKSSEKNSYVHPWVQVKLPDRPELTGQTLHVTIDLNVSFPEMSGNNFLEQNRSFHRTADIRLATPQAGKTYDGYWWLGVAGGGGLVLAMNLALIGIANALKRQALETKSYAVKDDQGDMVSPA
jgi:hypothetical protein